jgi:hypothetical protein
MARENQGLQIALIIFVMLTVVLGATTYWTYRLYDEQAIKAKSALADASKNNDVANKHAKDIEDLKWMIGALKTEDIGKVRETFDLDIKNYGGAYPEQDRFYHHLVEKLWKTIKDRNVELADIKARIPQIQAEYKSREDARELQLKQFEKARDSATQDLAKEKATFTSERDRISQDEVKHRDDLAAARKQLNTLGANLDATKLQYEQRIKKLLDANEEAQATIKRVTERKMGIPNGEVSWVSQRNNTVWINLGRADGLMRQVTFGVYPADSTDVTESKAGVEVTQILGDHLAEARILTDNTTNPIIPGDKIFTPLWSPGEKRHFALAGLMDVDGDGRNDLETIRRIIEIAGGEVDCYIGDSGRDKNKVVGRIKDNTNLLILGAAPDDRGEPAQREAFTKILREADQFRLQKMQLADFLQRIGWKNMSPVVRYGRGANPNDFRAKPEEGTVPKSTGNPSDVFKDREPAKGSSGGRYYRY